LTLAFADADNSLAAKGREFMNNRPVSLTIIAWLLIVLALFGLYGTFTIQNNPIAMEMLAKSGGSLNMHRAMGIVGSLVNLGVAYGIFKAQPWSRVLYVAWSVLSLVLTAILMPMVSALVLGVIILLVIGFFLFSLKANEYFAARGLALRREEG
jgi:hypothetical protein